MPRTTDDAVDRDRATGPNYALIIAAVVVSDLVLETLVWATDRGGLFSLVAAGLSIRSSAAYVDVDSDALMFPIFICVAAITAFACQRLEVEVDWATRQGALGPIAIIVLVGFILNALCNEPIIQAIMASNGYHRCATRDHFTRTGKGAPRFENFVFRPEDCKANYGGP